MKKKIIFLIVLFCCTIIFIYSAQNLIKSEKKLYTVITTEDLISKINNDDSFTIFFYQKYCMPCKEVETIINEYIKIESKPIFAIDLSNADKESYLVNIIKISETPTVISFRNGKEIKRISSVFTKKEFEEFIVE